MMQQLREETERYEEMHLLIKLHSGGGLNKGKGVQLKAQPY